MVAVPPTATPETAGIWKVAKVNSRDYDVFLSYNDADEVAVERLARRLRDEGLHVFFDPWSLVPGEVKLGGYEKALKRSQACAIFLGPQGRSPWQNAGVFMALQLAVEECGCHIVPVLLPGADPADANTLPLFLRSRTWVDFRAGLEDAAALHRLCCGVRGVPPDDFIGGTLEIDRDAIPSVRPLPPGSLRSYQLQHDVFLSYSHEDAVWVESLARRLEDEYSFTVWLDRWVLVPGVSWQQELARGLDEAQSCAVCIGATTPEGWFRQEIERALDRQTKDGSFRVIPVLLTNSSPDLVIGFLALRTWADFRHGQDQDYALHVLVQGILGKPIGRWPARDVQGVERDLAGYEKRVLELQRFRTMGIHEEVIIEFQRKLLSKWFDDEG